ncbi:Rossmann-fold NAD(P)-binding domain-containing protein [Flindersiella endophytica]
MTTNQNTNQASDNTGDLTLVLGGTGKSGRRVAERLEAHGVPARIGSRSADPAFDWDDQSTWAAALEGVRAVYVTYYPDLALPGVDQLIGAFSEFAVNAGARKLVLLSGRGEEGARRSEEALQASGAEWTVIRSSWFSQNFSEDFLLHSVLSGEIALPAQDVPEPFTDVEDIAEIAVAALTTDDHIGRVYEVTGPRLLTFADVAEELSKVTGRQIRYVPVSAERCTELLVAQGLPIEAAAGITEMFTSILDGRNADVMDGIEQALGRPGRDFSEYARLTAATGVWSA